jgi:dipeptidyl aminopeptidase/acylaminoacyl peptidase
MIPANKLIILSMTLPANNQWFFIKKIFITSLIYRRIKMKYLFKKSASLIAPSTIFLFLFVFNNSVFTQNDVPRPSFETIISLRSAFNPVISPDGQSIAFQIRTVDWKNNRYDTEIWLSHHGEKPFQLTRTENNSSGSPKWSPDGKWIAFIADRGNKNQIYLIRPYGGEAQPITEVKEGINNFEWSPDGKHIAFTKIEKESKKDEERKERYGEFTVEDAEYRFTHLWIVEVKPDLWPSPAEVPCHKEETSADSVKEENDSTSDDADCISLPKPEQYTIGDSFTVTSFSWSKDGKKIVFSHQRDPLRNSYATSNISILTVETKEIMPLVTDPGFDGGAMWSPDSRWILYYTSGGDTTSDYYKNRQIHKIPSSGGKSIRLAANFDENISVADWTSSGIYFLAFQKTKRHLFHLDPNSSRTKPLGGTPENIWSIDFSKDGKTVALAGQNSASLNEIYWTSLSKYEPVPVTDMTHQIEDLGHGTSEVVSWKSKDGNQIEGVLSKPKNFNPQKKYPLFVIIHGGPTSIDIPTPILGSVYPFVQWIKKGAIILRPNYRGSTGYGEKFRSLNVRNLGVGDAWDVLSGVDYLISQGFVDSTRIAAMGWSQGGYISTFLTTNTDRFKAISVGAGISNWVTYYVNTDIHPFTRQYLKATPWNDPNIYEKTSPMTTIKEAKTPTLIQHGELDKRVPIPNAYELFQGLQDMDIETKLIVYKGFGHGISKPKELLAAMWHNWQWFSKHIWDEKIDLPLNKTKIKNE